jgi:hypothetical protein
VGGGDISYHDENYGHMKIIFARRVPAASISPTAVHRALNHLMDYKEQATRYLVMSLAS